MVASREFNPTIANFKAGGTAMRKTVHATAFLFVSRLSALVSQGVKAAEVSQAEVRSAIEKFLADPLAAESKQWERTIALFTVESKDVAVLVTGEMMPWLGNQEDKYHSQLFTAFIAGNVRAQLDCGVKRNDTYSGVIQVFRVYRFLKTKDRDYRVDELEKLLDRHREGKLLESLPAMHWKPPATAPDEKGD